MIPVGTNRIEAHFQTPIPPVLWHYTSVLGAKGILRSKGMWATDARFLNDTQEFRNWQSFVETYVEERKSKTLSLVARAILEGGVQTITKNKLFTPEGLNLYVLCLSTAEDDLTQWRYYGDDHKGCCLGSDLRGWRPAYGTDTSVRFAPCIYDDQIKEQMVADAADNFLSEFALMDQRVDDPKWVESQLHTEQRIRNAFRRSFSHEEQRAFIQIEVKRRLGQVRLSWIIDMFSLATHFKHKSYSSECEWRLTLPSELGHSAQLGKLRTRTDRAGRNSEYVEVDVQTPDRRFSLVELMYGQCCPEDQELIALFAPAGCNPVIRRSALPVACS